jgi:hypothetical protein
MRKSHTFVPESNLNLETRNGVNLVRGPHLLSIREMLLDGLMASCA